MNKKKKSIQYQWHPVLLRIYNCQHFQWLLAQRYAPFCRSPSCYTVPTLYIPSLKLSDHQDTELRLIAYPLLTVSLWPSQDKPPKDVILIKQQLTDDEVETLIISELMRLICFHSEPDESVCESVRLLLNSVISETVRRSYFGKKKLSQTFFGQMIGLTREQLAHGADKIKEKNRSQISRQHSAMNRNIFDEVLS